MFLPQLAAGRPHLCSHLPADGHAEAALLQQIVKAQHPFPGAGAKAGIRGVIGDEVERTGPAGEQAAQLQGLIVAVVHSRQHGVFEDHLLPGAPGVIPGRFQHAGQIEATRHRHQLPPQLVVGRVQADAEIVGSGPLGEAADTVGQAAGGDGDVPRPHIQPGGRGRDIQKGVQAVMIVERLAHAHDGQGVDGSGSVCLRAQQLPHHLRGRKVADQAVFPAGAKGAAHGTACLAGKAQAPAVAVLHDHAFHAVAVPQAQQVFYGLFVFQPPQEGRTLQAEIASQFLPQAYAKGRHVGEGRTAFPIEPAEHDLRLGRVLILTPEILPQLLQRLAVDAWVTHVFIVTVRCGAGKQKLSRRGER